MRFRCLFWFCMGMFPLWTCARADKIDTAERALEDRLLGVAEIHFRDVLEEADAETRVRARMGLARIALLRERPEAAEEMLKTLPPLDNPVWIGRANLVAADAAWMRGDHGRVRTLLEVTPALEGEWGRRRTRIEARLLAAEDRLDEALDLLSGSDAPAAFTAERAGLLQRAGREEEAVALWRELAEGDVETLPAQRARLALARRAREAGDWEEVGTHVDAMLEEGGVHEPLEVEAYPLIVALYTHREDFDRAVDYLEALEKRLKPSGTIADLRAQRAEALVRAGELEAAQSLLADLIASEGDFTPAARAQLLLARARAEKGDPAAAAKIYETYLSVFTDPEGVAEAWSGLAGLREDLEKWSEAARAYGRAAELVPKDSDARATYAFKQADMWFAGGEMEAAYRGFESFLASYPDHEWVPRAKFHSAVAMVEGGISSIYPAERRLRRLRLEHPESAFAERALLQIAALHRKAKNLPEARTAYAAYLEQYPEGAYRVDAMVDEAVVRYLDKRFQGALSGFDEVIEAFPEHPRTEQARALRGWTLHLLGEEEEARRAGEDFLRSFPESDYVSDVRLWLASLAFNRGAYEEAEEIFVALSGMPVEAEVRIRARYLAGRAALARKAYAQAQRHFSRVAEDVGRLEGEPSEWLRRYAREALFYQGDALTEMNRFDEAILIFEQVQSRYPDSNLKYAALGRKGDCQFTLGAENPDRYREALHSYRQVVESNTGQREILLQALYKQGRTLEALERMDEALAAHQAAMDFYLRERRVLTPEADVWFVRAVTDAAQAFEEREAYRDAVRVYRYLAGTELPQAEEARRRIAELNRTHRLLMFEGELDP